MQFRAGLLYFAATLCAAQEPFHVDVRLVNVAFSVRDARGLLVTNLTQDDFEVFEDGAPQKISFFARSLSTWVWLPILAGARRSSSGRIIRIWTSFSRPSWGRGTARSWSVSATAFAWFKATPDRAAN
jgi:hypothetical protein